MEGVVIAAKFKINLGLFLDSKSLSRILFMDYLYKKNIDLQGVVMEFGVRWGQNCSLFSALRGIYEPFNRHRKIIGFDTFTGFPSVSKKDGKTALAKAMTAPSNRAAHTNNIPVMVTWASV